MNDRVSGRSSQREDHRLIIEKSGYSPDSEGPRLPPNFQTDEDLRKGYRPISDGPSTPHTSGSKK